MGKRCLHNRNGGFSMVEMLAVVAIIVILLGVSMVSAARYRDLLKITELDNAAREIYMAAENRAVLLSGARRLNNQVVRAGTAAALSRPAGTAGEAYYVAKDGVTEDLLPTGSVDPALREEGVDFFIVYDRAGGSVTDVFYAEQSMADLVGGGFEAFYADWAKSRSERLKQKDRMLVGWYSGEAAQGGELEPEIPEEPAIRVLITNEEELTVTVEYTAPGPARLSVRLEDIDLTGGGYQARKSGENIRTGADGVFYRCTWVLDSLEKEEWRFSRLGSAAAPGSDITVTAAITPQDGASFEEASASDTNNSLFQEGSGGDTAYVKYLRHLQNLDSSFSGVKDKTAAVQTAGIRCRGNETYGDYDFLPIFNGKLESYDGRANEIRGLYVSGTKLTGDNAHAGLFSRTTGGTAAAKPVTFRNIRLVNASVTASGENHAGALAGSISDAIIQNCWVYLEPDGEVTDLKDVLGSDTGGTDHYRYQITGSSAGGLVGYSKGRCEITNSLAATLVSGRNNTGGLIGEFAGSPAIIQYSYADCYLTGGADANVAGLIGLLSEGKTVQLTNCYAAGYIMGGRQAAGLCLGGGTTGAVNVYSAMRYPTRDIKDTFTFLTGCQASDSFENTHFLGKASQEIRKNDGTVIRSTTYDVMTSDGFIGTMGGGFQRKESDSHPYNLREHLTLNIYSFPGLKHLPHYGDWGAEFKEPSLVYYERYGDDTWGVSGGNARDLVNNLEDRKFVLSDGYAVAFLRDDLKATSVKVVYTYLDKDGATKNITVKAAEEDLVKTSWKNDEGNAADYYMIPLPDELVNSEYAQDCFYRYLKFELDLGGGGEQPSGEYFFNPHFAETVAPVAAQEGTEGGWTSERAEAYAKGLAANMNGTREVKLRTPRHLYSLSEFREYYSNARRDVFRQVLDLDYAGYAGYNGRFQAQAGKPLAQQPIGRAGEPFTGTYNGDCRSIKNVVFKVDDLMGRRYAGLFGYSTGTLRSIVYEMDPEYQVIAYLGRAAENLYVGALVGGNAGTVYNCAVLGVNLRAGASGVSLYVGGLAGQNQGVIQNSAAEFARLSANCFNYASVYIGGLVGENAAARSISASYAVGRIDAEVDATITTARICGFVGWNYGDISKSYAAVDLQSSGENVDAYGFCGARYGSQSGTAYLDQGNFTYRGTSYAANYRREGDKAESTVYGDLTAVGKAASLDMGTVWQGERPDPEKEYPYPTAVRDRNGSYVHYGKWPELMPLGEMGVFYWEKLADASDGVSNPTYHLSALAVDPAKKTITKQTTLSEVHNDGRVVVDYGYGYYYQGTDKTSVTLETENIGNTPYMLWSHRDNNSYLNFSSFNKLDPNQARAFYEKDPANELQAIKEGEKASQAREAAAEKGLSDLIKGYTFRCWNTYREAPRAASENDNIYRAKQTVSGLCLYRTDTSKSLDPNSGVFRLKQGALQVEFTVNPQFADAMSVRSAGGLTVTGGASEKAPGITEENPYQVRSGLQLQDINWYDTAYTDVPVGLGRYSVTRFPYLNNSYYWKQTHDIDWDGEEKSYNPYENGGNDNKNGVFFPIAQGYAQGDGASLSGWFQGTYDGGNYTLKNFNVGINEKDYQINTMGLFGVAKNAALKNIVLYSETGNDTVTVRGRTDATGNNAWYAGGVLAGLALDSEISNCAVAGYTVRDETKCARSVQSGSSYTMGGAIGGLVGMTNKDLTGCTAAATLEIACDHQNNGSSAPIRVGGLAGSTTAGVTNCYTGGEIVVDGAKNAAIYAGRLIGGVGMGPFGDEGGGAAASVKSCYSYLTLPQTGGVVKEVYNIGGRGRTSNTGTVSLDNNYYLSGKAGAMNNGERAVTHRQLASLEEIDGQDVYVLLNGAQNPKPYHPVTSEVSGLAMAGRFSYAPQNRLELQGLDYPFPTVLTQTRVSDGMVFNVHYGGWALSGIVRADGNRPIELDMFAKPVNGEKEGTLGLSAGITGGTWGPGAETIFGDGVVKAKVEDGKLTVTALKASDTPVTVTVTYKVGDVIYSLPITVYVTANVELRPNAVSIFPGDAVEAALTPWGVVPGTKEYRALAPEGLTDIQAVSLSDAITARTAEPGAEGPAVSLTRSEGGTGQVWVDVTCTYTQDGYAQEGVTQRISVTLLDLPEGRWDGDVWTMDFTGHEVNILTAEIADGTLEGFTAGAADGVITLTKGEGAADVTQEGRLSVTLILDGLTHRLTITVPPKPAEP